MEQTGLIDLFHGDTPPAFGTDIEIMFIQPNAEGLGVLDVAAAIAANAFDGGGDGGIDGDGHVSIWV